MYFRNVLFDDIKDVAYRYGNVFETEEWAIFKKSSAWDYEIIGIYEEDELIGYFVPLIRNVHIGKMIYIPRGPVIIDWKNLDYQAFKKCLIEYAHKKRVMDIKIDPYILHACYEDLNEKPSYQNEEITDNLIKIGFDHTGYNYGYSANINPRYQAFVYPENYARGNKKLRQYVNIAKRRGVYTEIYEGKQALPVVDAFFDILHKTEERKNIRLRNADYFRKMVKTMSDVVIILGKVDLKKRKEEYEKALAAYIEESKHLDDINLKQNYQKLKNRLDEEKVSLDKEKKVIEEAINTYGENTVVVSGCLCISNKVSSELIYAGFDGSFSYYSPAYLTWADTIEYCFDKGKKSVNLGGISGYADDHLLKFKKIFNPVINEYLGEFDLVTNKLLFMCFNKAMAIYKKIR